MNVVEKINLILKKANISKVNLAGYLGVSRQMVYNYLDGSDLSKLPNEKCQLLFELLNVNSAEEIMNIDVNKIITLGNKEKYLVISHVVNNLKDYYYIAEVDETGKDIKDNYKIVCATYKDNEVYLDEVLGEDKLKSILPMFVKE